MRVYTVLVDVHTDEYQQWEATIGVYSTFDKAKEAIAKFHKDPFCLGPYDIEYRCFIYRWDLDKENRELFPIFSGEIIEVEEAE